MRAGVLIAAALTAAPAIAQDTELGSRIVRPHIERNALPSDRAQVGARSMASCVVNRRWAAAATMLDTLDPAVERKYSTVLGGEVDCLGLVAETETQSSTVLTASPPLWRGLIAEQMVLQRYPHAPVAAEPLRRQYASAWTPLDGRSPVVDDMATCVASSNPDGVRALIATVPATPAEAAAMTALSPSLGQCLQANATLNGNRQSVRAALAEALYHRLATPAGAVK